MLLMFLMSCSSVAMPEYLVTAPTETVTSCAPDKGKKEMQSRSARAGLVIRDRVVQGALKLILEPIFEADFQSGSFRYRPKRTAHEAVARVARAIVEEKTRRNFGRWRMRVASS